MFRRDPHFPIRSQSVPRRMEPQACERHGWAKPRGRDEWERVSQILNGGAMPLDLLQERVETWVKQQKSWTERMGMRDLEGKATRVGASKPGGERDTAISPARLTQRSKAFARCDPSVRAQSPELDSSHRMPDLAPSTTVRLLWGASSEQVHRANDPSHWKPASPVLKVPCLSPTLPLPAAKIRSSGWASPAARRNDLQFPARRACARAGMRRAPRLCAGRQMPGPCAVPISYAFSLSPIEGGVNLHANLHAYL